MKIVFTLQTLQNSEIHQGAQNHSHRDNLNFVFISSLNFNQSLSLKDFISSISYSLEYATS